MKENKQRDLASAPEPTPVSDQNAESIKLIHDCHVRIVLAGKTSTQLGLTCGQLLLEQKERVKRNRKARWLEWLKENCPEIQERTAQNYMALARAAKDPQVLSEILACESLWEAYFVAKVVKHPTEEPEACDDEKKGNEYTPSAYETIDLFCRKIEALLECPLMSVQVDEERIYQRLEFAETHRIQYRQRKNIVERIAA